MAKTFSAPPFRRGKTSRAPPSRFVAPPLPVISDHSLIDMRQGFKKYSDMRQGHFLNLTCDMSLNKRQRHVTLTFLKIDRRHGDLPSRAPLLFQASSHPSLQRNQSLLKVDCCEIGFMELYVKACISRKTSLTYLSPAHLILTLSETTFCTTCVHFHLSTAP